MMDSGLSKSRHKEIEVWLSNVQPTIPPSIYTEHEETMLEIPNTSKKKEENHGASDTKPQDNLIVPDPVALTIAVNQIVNLKGLKKGTRAPLIPSVRTYRKTCKKLRILPIRRVLAQLGGEIVILKDMAMSSADINATCAALALEDETKHLDLSGNSIGYLESQFVHNLLQSNPCLTELYLGDNLLASDGIAYLVKDLTQDKTIKILDLSGNKLTDRDGIHIHDIIKMNKVLQVFLLHHNQFQDGAGKLIGKAIAENDSLEHLDLCWNHLRQQGAVGVARGLKKNCRLTFINLGWNGFGFEGCVALAEALERNTTLEKLDVSCNRIHPPALLELMKGVSVNKTIKTLVLDNNPITPPFASIILDIIKRSPTMVITHLSMKGVVVETSFHEVLESILETRNLEVSYETALPVSGKDRNELLREVETRNTYNIEPLRLLYLLKERNRAQDFFHKINKDHDDGVTPDELCALFKDSGIPVSRMVIDRIMQFMDTDHDGKIDLGEFLKGDKKIKKIARDHARNSLQIGEEDNYSQYSRTFRKAHIQQLTATCLQLHRRRPLLQAADGHHFDFNSWRRIQISRASIQASVGIITSSVGDQRFCMCQDVIYEGLSCKHQTTTDNSILWIFL